MRRKIVIGVLLVLSTGVGPPAFAAGGDLDPTFGGDGTVSIDSPGGGVANAVAIQADGKIVVAGGTAYGRKNPRFVLARAGADGTLDRTFGRNGIVTTDFGRRGEEAALGVAVQPDGKIVAVGFAGARRYYGLSSGRNPRIAIARYEADGMLDPSFGGDGKVTTDLFVGRRRYIEAGNGLVIQADGRIVVVGQAGAAGAALVRYDADGTLDEAFGTAGSVVVHDRDSRFQSVAIDATGRILAGGTTGYEFAVARYLADGTTDTAFGHDGWAIAPFGLSWAVANSVAVQPDGEVVAGGDWTIGCWPGGHCDDVLALARYTTDGSLDASFGEGGIVTSDFKGWIDAIAVQSDGKIVGAGSAVGRFALVRYETDGSPDQTFGGDGRISVFPDFSDATAVAIQADEKIVAAGFGGGSSFSVARCLPA
jgi:uncharacterized delta-60 repeat protein